MAEVELKLTGDEGDGDGDDERPAERPAKKKAKRGGAEQPGARSRRRSEGELRDRLGRVFERLAEWLDGRGDVELASAIREDAGAMTGGLISLTRPLAWLRAPIIFALSIVEPALAFGRVLRILAGRVGDRRARKAGERAVELADVIAAQGTEELRAALEGNELGEDARALALDELNRRGAAAG